MTVIISTLVVIWLFPSEKVAWGIFKNIPAIIVALLALLLLEKFVRPFLNKIFRI